VQANAESAAGINKANITQVARVRKRAENICVEQLVCLINAGTNINTRARRIAHLAWREF